MTDLRTQLRDIYAQHGQLTPTLLVGVARDENHPLHSRFEWNDAVAGEAYRNVQARELIRSVRVVYREATATDPARSVRAFHSLADEDSRGYHPVEEIAGDDIARQILLRDMQRAWQDMKRRYSEFEEFWALVRDSATESAA